jgi:hypothetical protein
MSVPLEPLRHITTKELGRMAVKYPKVAIGLESLKKRALSRLDGDTIEHELLGEILEAIVGDADKLEEELGNAAGGYVFAAAQDLIAKLENLAKEGLSKGVSILPELNVELSLSDGTKRRGRKMTKAGLGHRTKFGGSPDWIQNNQTPICGNCKRPMTFVAQIDSVSAAENELGRTLRERGSYMFADVGMMYVFWCGKCNETQSVLQCS